MYSCFKLLQGLPQGHYAGTWGYRRGYHEGSGRVRDLVQGLGSTVNGSKFRVEEFGFGPDLESGFVMFQGPGFEILKSSLG